MWSGELHLEEYYKTLRDVDKNMQDIKQKFHISGIIAGMDYRGNDTDCCEIEANIEGLLMEWITKHDVKFANTFSKGWEPTRAMTNKLDFWEQNEARDGKNTQ